MLKSVAGLILMLHLFSPGQVMQASAAIQAIATNPVTQRVESGTLKMSAVPLASGLPSGTALSIGAKRSYFFVKNFGTLNLSSFALQQTVGATITYCHGLGFRSSPPSYDICADGTAATVVGSANSIAKIALAATLSPGQSHQFAAVTTANGGNSISISVTPANR